MTNEAVRDARDAVLEAYDDSMTSPNFEADREHDDRFIAALDAYEAAIRADERDKWDAVKQGYVDAAATIEREFRHYRERFEPIMEEAVASERAKVEALVEAARAARHHPTFCILRQPQEGCVCGVTALEKAVAALDAVRAGRA